MLESGREGDPTMFRTMTVLACAALMSTAAVASISNFNTTTNQISTSAYQLVDEFEILYSGANAYIDWNLDNVPDMTVPVGLPDHLALYVDPEHYTLDFGSGLMPYFMGSELSGAASVEWRLSYVMTPGSMIAYSTIMSGTTTDNGDGTWTLDINGGLEWPVNGMPANDLGVPEGTHIAAQIADFTSFNWDGETLMANVPAPAALSLLAIAGLGSHRRRRR
jgi:MYXO-CTERM domain-containing protein